MKQLLLSLPASLQQIIWKLNTQRHYGHITEIPLLDTTPYREKKNVAIFRGAMTGSSSLIVDIVDTTTNATTNNATITFDEAYCRSIQRTM